MGGEFSEIDDEVAGGLFEEVCWREEVWPGRQGEASWQMGMNWSQVWSCPTTLM